MEYCCAFCFISDYIKQIISSDNQKGDCAFCHTQDTFVYAPNKIYTFFVAILDLYEPNINGEFIENQILIDFPEKIFSKEIELRKIRILIEKIVEEDTLKYENIFTNKVKLKLNTTITTQKMSQLWDNFSEEIIHKNRFHLSNIPDITLLKSLFKNYDKIISVKTEYYRGRIAQNRNGYSTNEMGCPPKNKATGGRANPEGISYLYVANNIQTSIREIRANLLDYICIGRFVTIRQLKVINLSNRTYDIFRLAESETLEEVLLYKEFIEKLENQLSTPRRGSDSILDYLPSQYLSELIKSMGYDGIEYKSSLFEGGDNLAFFNPDDLKCIDTKMFDIKNIILGYDEIS